MPPRLSTRRASRSLVAAAVVCSFVPVVVHSAAGLAPKDTAWRGPLGVTESTAAIMVRQQREAPRIASRLARQEDDENTKGRDRSTLRQAPGAPSRSSYPDAGPAVRATAPATPQTVPLNFAGATLADTGAFPPDSMGAVGPTQFLVGVNGRVRTFTKTGTADGVLDADSDVFFASVLPGGSFTSDPRVRYDRTTDRWFMTMLSATGNPSEPPNKIFVAVSDTGVLNGSTTWTFWSFEHDLVGSTPNSDTGAFADYDTLGIDANALYIGVNIFSAAGSFQNTTGFVVQKASVLGAGPIRITPFRGLINVGGTGPFSPQGADNLYGSASDSGYFIGVDNNLFGKLDIVRIANPGTLAPSIAATPSVTGVNTTALPDLTGVPQSGSSKRLDALDDRLFMATIRNGHLWAAQNIGTDSGGVADTTSPDRTSSRWYDIQNLSTSPAVNQSGTVVDSAGTSPRSYWMPSVAVSGQGHAAFGGSTSGSTHNADAFTVGRLAGDALGSTGTPNIYTASTFVYGPQGSTKQRWGDYSYTTVDPNDDMTMWTINEYADALNSYAVQIAKLLAPPPATPASAGGPVAAGLCSTSVTITGTSASGSGFFEPGTSFSNHLTATVSGGVVVNSVTVTDATHLNLDLNTTAASSGAKDVTITNPDGQAALGSAILTLTGTPTTAICGRVFRDVNGNGVRDAGELGLPGATVKLDAGADGSFETTTTSDSGGSYEFAGLANGTYRVRQDPPSGWQQTSTDPPDPVISAGTGVNGVDFGDQLIPPPTTTTTTTIGPPPGGGGGGGGGGGSDPVTRIAGDDRILTAIAVSKDSYPTDGSAGAVVLARSDGFADALAGTPLAIANHAPLLLTPSHAALDGRVSSEIARLLPAGRKVFVLGGPGAIDPSVDAALGSAGFDVVRLQGPDRYATAAAVAHDGLGDPPTQLLATGTDFADALAGGAAAGAIGTGASILLTNGSTMPAATAAYMSAHPASARYALGGPAAAAAPAAAPIVGANRFETSVKVAQQFFNHPNLAGVAYGFNFPDALAGGTHIGTKRGPLLLTDTKALPAEVNVYLTAEKSTIAAAWVYGGPAVIDDSVLSAVQRAIT